MRIFLAIAWRNVLRNKKRSALSILAVVVGLVAMIMVWSLMDGVYPVLVGNLTSFTGHFEITATEYVDKPLLENAVTDGSGIIEAVAADKVVTAYSPRLLCNGMISFGANSQGALIMGVDPELERRFSRLTEMLGKGGEWLRPGGEGVILGSILAKNLNVASGDEVLLVISDRSRQLAYIGPMAVVGLIDSGLTDIDRSAALVDRGVLAGAVFANGDAGGSLSVDPKGVFSELLVKVKDPDLIEGAKKELQGMMPGGITVRSWKDVNPWVESTFKTKAGFTYIVFFIVLLIVIAGVLNTILMSVVERTREFGIMRSLGTKRWQIFATVVSESIMLGLVGIVIGTMVGVALVLYFGHVGIDVFGAFDKEMLGRFYIIDRVFYPRLDLEHFANTCMLMMLAVIIVSLYPARKASRLQPVEAIKTLG
jgi:putative ABC transport system permease protein